MPTIGSSEMLLNQSPVSLGVKNIGDGVLVHGEQNGDIHHRKPEGVPEYPRNHNILLVKFGVILLGTVLIFSPVFCHAVVDIILRAANEKMVRVDAWRYVALVTDKF